MQNLIVNMDKLDKSQKAAFEAIINNPKRNIFVQGQAGSGKSYLIRCIKQVMERKGRQLAVVAPTGIAAELIGGSTIHSMFRLGAHNYFPQNIVEEYRMYQEIVKHISTLIIDEVSMLRADVFDTIDALCKRAKGNKQPFGGIQIVLIGDLYQLPPVYRTDDEEARRYLSKTYGQEKPFFFDAACYKEGNFQLMQLTENHRQQGDDDFIGHLQSIGQGKDLEESLEYFNAQVGLRNENVSIVTARRDDANRINEARLSELPGEKRTYMAEATGPYYTGEAGARHIEEFHVPQCLELKVGARVMICKNDPEGKYVNGSMGRVEAFGQDSITVCLDNKTSVDLKKEKWEQQEYYLNADEQLELKTIGEFVQYPLKLAYAITIHKSQGQTWDNVYIDLGQNGAFAEGQVYVALSRVRSINGVNLCKRLRFEDIIINPRVREFIQNGGKLPETPLIPKSPFDFEAEEESIMSEVNGRRNRVSSYYVSYRTGQSWGCWTIYNYELHNDLYLVVGRRDAEVMDRMRYIFKIRGGSFEQNDFVPNNQARYKQNVPFREDQNRRDIKINLRDCKEMWMNRQEAADFYPYLWKVIDYKERTIESPNPGI